MLTSTKISFGESLCSYDEIYMSVISQVTLFISTIFLCKHYKYDIVCCSCDMFYVYNIYRNSNVTFLSKYDMCIMCENIVMYQCTCNISY